jgi:VWFA-related protein
LVEVPVVVRDRRHQAVTGLRQQDFAIYDSGRKQEITAFSVETFAPRSDAAPVPSLSTGPPGGKPANSPKDDSPRRYVALCFDDLSTDFSSLAQAKTAARQFVKTALAPGDRVAVVTTAWPRTTEFTDDIPTMLALIDKVAPNPRYSDNVLQCPPIRAYEAYLIDNHMDSSVLQAKVAEYQACAGGRPPRPADTVTAMATGIWEHALSVSKATLRAVDSLVQSLAKIPGRRMILLSSSGFLTGNLENDEDELIARALDAGVVINTLSARGLYTVVPGGDAAETRPTGRTPRQAQIVDTQTQARQESAKDDGMAVLAAGTGGSFFHDNNDLLRGFRQLGMEPDVMYVLGFAPNDAVADGRYHSLKVRLASEDRYSVQARMGYSAPPKPTPVPSAPPSRLDSEMMATDILADLPASITGELDKPKGGVTYTAHIDLSRLKLETRQGRRAQKLTFVAVLRDAGGSVVAGKRSDVELNLTDASFARLAASGVRIALTLEAPPGTYAARCLLQEGLDGKLVTASQELTIQ